jgi:hypothetical protein
MPSRRRLLRTSVAVGTASTAGCLGDVGDVLETRRLQAVNVFLENDTTKSRPFHVMLELESGPTEWRTTQVTGGTSEQIAFEPGPDATPSQFHAVVSEHAEIGTMGGIDGAEGEFCVPIRIRLDSDGLGLYQLVSYECDVDL